MSCQRRFWRALGRWLCVLSLPFTLGSCAQGLGFTVQVDSLRDPGAAVRTRYVLVPAVENVRENDLQYREFATYIRRALAQRGFTEASPETADLSILVTYGIGNPETRAHTYSVPVFGQTGGGTATYSGSSVGPGGSTFSHGTINQPAQFGVVGSVTKNRSVTTYFRFLTLEAVDLATYRQTQAIVPLWKTTVSSTGTSPDLRLVFPVLVGAAADYVGTDTGRQVRIDIRDTDPRVLRIRDAAPEAR